MSRCWPANESSSPGSRAPARRCCSAPSPAFGPGARGGSSGPKGGGRNVYLPRVPYLPPGTLREVLAYPWGVEKFTDGAFAPALTRVDLARLVPMLDSTQRWEKDLSEDEQHSLVFARALLHEPRWMIIDEGARFPRRPVRVTASSMF